MTNNIGKELKPIMKKNTKRKIPPNEISIFCAQAAMLLKAGIPLSEGLSSMSGAESGEQNPLLTRIAEKVGETGSLYDAVDDVGVFPHYMVNMIKIGETVGKLEEVLESLSVYYNREEKLRDALRGALLYPVILIVMMSAVISLLVVFILPVFSDVFESLGLNTAGTGTGLLSVGEMIGRVALICSVVLFALMLVVLLIALIPKGRAALVKLSGRLPILSSLFGKIASGRFALVMYMMLNSGYDLEQALEMSAEVITDRIVKEKILKCSEKLKEGTPFSVALLEIGLFSGLYARMVQTGERTGRLDDVMDQLSVRINDDIDKSLTDLISFIEPTLVVLLSVIIGTILLSIMLPLMDVMSRIG